MSELIKADNEYKEWIAGISTDFRKSQIRASMKINDEMLRFYWKLGNGISSIKVGRVPRPQELRTAWAWVNAHNLPIALILNILFYYFQTVFANGRDKVTV